MGNNGSIIIINVGNNEGKLVIMMLLTQIGPQMPGLAQKSGCQDRAIWFLAALQ